jgi:hypothetical protein
MACYRGTASISSFNSSFEREHESSQTASAQKKMQTVIKNSENIEALIS